MSASPVKKVSFVKSSAKLDQCPGDGKPEYAFIGRSNVGKSSLLNMLANRHKLAKVSGTPGKTQLINHFLFDEKWYLVDLPGYGWAKVSKTKKLDWSKMVRDYLLKRKELLNLFVLIDSRLPPQEIDLTFLNWAGEKQIPLSVIFTKTDKVKPHELQENILVFQEAMAQTWGELPPMFTSSATKKQGGEDIIRYIRGINREITG